ncbi:hypothetical protein THAOC_15422 [Thalassiosira oceanica]|uniref:ABM domain-containing protein n=1 Tax=Thalassiosira oceanica TaxID=159749 RepID=K0SS53_THAOC|nr:hypothetical protein THAOC_15422 [Thalassiosira oceanica]|eukprot:EJK63896.1 hypothetical protein THAOC_15422 [Thalassiosira oceanica]
MQRPHARRLSVLSHALVLLPAAAFTAASPDPAQQQPLPAASTKAFGINAAFRVRPSRRDEFVRVLTSSRPEAATQFVLGRDADDEGKFYLHEEFDSRTDNPNVKTTRVRPHARRARAEGGEHERRGLPQRGAVREARGTGQIPRGDTEQQGGERRRAAVRAVLLGGGHIRPEQVPLPRAVRRGGGAARSLRGGALQGVGGVCVDGSVYQAAQGGEVHSAVG